MNKYIKELPGGDFKVEHKIDDPNGISKQYPKIMKMQWMLIKTLEQISTCMQITC